jgi:hypothetical protein
MTVTVYKPRRGIYKIIVFTLENGVTTYKIKGKQEMRAKVKALEKMYENERSKET